MQTHLRQSMSFRRWMLAASKVASSFARRVGRRRHRVQGFRVLAGHPDSTGQMRRLCLGLALAPVNGPLLVAQESYHHSSRDRDHPNGAAVAAIAVEGGVEEEV